MPKGIVEIEMPICCETCPLCTIDENYHSGMPQKSCYVIGYMDEWELGYKNNIILSERRHPLCPIKEDDNGE